MKFLKQFILFIILASSSMIVNADANPDLWPFIKEKMFKDKAINEVDFLKIDGPKRASSGAQVPINIKITQQPDIEIKKLIVIKSIRGMP